VHFSITNDDLRLFILIEGDETAFNGGFEMEAAKVLLTMKLQEITDIESAVPDGVDSCLINPGPLFENIGCG